MVTSLCRHLEPEGWRLVSVADTLNKGWVRAHATIVPTSPIAAPEGTDLTMLLSEPSIDTIAAAKETVVSQFEIGF